MKLLGKEVDTEVAVLPCLSRRVDADDLAWSALKVEDVSSADVMAWDGDGLNATARCFRDDSGLRGTTTT